MTHMVISVGQFIYRKGFDVLLKAWSLCPEDNKLFIVGDEPSKEIIELKDRLGLNNVFFPGYKSKEELKEYYNAADLFVLPTREDIWGLVINEAMAHGLPVITTDHCVAGMELVDNGQNGYIVPVDNYQLLGKRINTILNDDVLRARMSEESLKKIRNYTIENMAEEHLRGLLKYNEI